MSFRSTVELQHQKHQRTPRPQNLKTSSSNLKSKAASKRDTQSTQRHSLNRKPRHSRHRDIEREKKHNLLPHHPRPKKKDEQIQSKLLPYPSLTPPSPIHPSHSHSSSFQFIPDLIKLKSTQRNQSHIPIQPPIPPAGLISLCILK